MEIMRLTFRMDLLVGQAPNGVVHTLNATKSAQYSNMMVKKQQLTAELFALMTNNGDL